jgi:hypothetical protein
MPMRRRVMEPAVAELLDRVNEVLDSTEAFPWPIRRPRRQ